MSQTDPNLKAYGAGYTGRSDGWVHERVSLDAYAGGEVLLRFEMITDDATTQPGMVVDNLVIPEIAYREDFEESAGGWQAEGWIYTDNRLPQQFWLQIAEFVGEDIVIHRWLLDESEQITMDLAVGTETALLALSPIAPLTVVSADYRLRIATD